MHKTIKNRLGKNTTYLLIATVISNITYFLAVMYMARFLGVQEFGIIALAISFTGIFSIFTDLGLNMLTVREVSRNHSLKNKYMGNITGIKALLSTITLISVLLVVNILGYDAKTVMVIFLVTLAIVISSFFLTFFSIYQALEKMKYQALITGFDNIFMLGTVGLAIYFSLDLIAFATLYLIRNLLILSYMFMAYIKSFKLPKIQFDFSFWKDSIKEALPFALSGIFLTLFIWIPSIILSLISGKEAVGFYGAPNKLIFFFISLYGVYMIAVFPVMSSFYKKSKNYLKSIFEQSFRYTLIICIPASIIISFLAPQIIKLVFGESYLPSSGALTILSWTLILVSLNGLSSNLLGSVNRQLTVIKITILGIIINISASFLLIPRFSFMGASLATIITDIIVMVILLYSVTKMGYANLKIFRALPKILLGILVMVMVIMDFEQLNFILKILSGLICYVIIIITVKEKDFSLIKKIFRKPGK